MEGKNKNLERVIFRLKSLSNDMGIYPGAVKGLSEEKNYTERDGYKNGWNAAVTQYGLEFDRILDEGGDPWSEYEKVFLADNESYFIYLEDEGWSVFLNDTWYYACSDWEPIPEDCYKEVVDLYRKYGAAGALYWVYKIRKDLPQIPSVKFTVLAIAKLEKDLREEKSVTWWWRKGFYLPIKISKFFKGIYQGIKHNLK